MGPLALNQPLLPHPEHTRLRWNLKLRLFLFGSKVKVTNQPHYCMEGTVSTTKYESASHWYPVPCEKWILLELWNCSLMAKRFSCLSVNPDLRFVTTTYNHSTQQHWPLAEEEQHQGICGQHSQQTEMRTPWPRADVTIPVQTVKEPSAHALWTVLHVPACAH